MADPIRFALFGCGVRGTEIAKALAVSPDAKMLAVAELYAGRRARATELIGTEVAVISDYRQLLTRRDIEAIVIATPDHSHVALATDALNAGKDVYCESPVLHSGQDTKLLLQASKGRVFQVGGALESTPSYLKAREIVLSGRLGRVTAVRAVWDSVSALEAWQRPFPPDASPATIDFAAFLGAAPKREFDLHRFFRWPCYWDYGSGLAGARLVPLLSAIDVVLGLKGPVRGSLSGGTWRWKDGREVPDTLVGTFDYDDGVSVSMAATQNGGNTRELRCIGTDATLIVTDTSAVVLPTSQHEPYTAVGESWSKDYRDWFYMMHGLSQQGVPRREFPSPADEEAHAVPQTANAIAAHLANFIECVRTRQEPKEPLRLGLASAQAVFSAGAALRQRARLVPR